MCLQVLVFLGLVSHAVGAAVATDHCVYQGKTYKVGDHTNTDPCYPCQCYAGGQVMCMAFECIPPNCVNPQRVAGQCCQVCPDGPNCKHGETVIKMDEDYHPDAHTLCRCAKDFSHLFGPDAHKAICFAV